MAGLTATGISIKSLDDILSDIEGDQIANIDPNLNLGPDDVLGQLNGIIAASLSELWELVEEVYQSAYPDTASGQSLSYIAALTGAIRQEATKAEVLVGMQGTVDAIIPAGVRAYPEDDPDSLFESTEDVDLGPMGFGDTTMIAVTPGSETFTLATGSNYLVIATPVSGLDTIVCYAQGFTAGVDEETDSALRIRRETTLARAGSSTVEAIRADMLEVPGVDTCTVFENPSGVEDPNGVPPFSIEVLVYNATAPSYTPEAVATQIFLSKPAGTQTYGSEGPVTVIDSLGNSHSIYYSEPTTINLYIAITLTETTDGSYVGDTAVKATLEQWGLNLEVGQSVYASDIVNVVADLAGVANIDVTNVFVEAGDATPDTRQWIATARQLGLIDDTRITVTSL